MYDKVTHDIKVSVEPVFLEDRSSPEEDYFVWAYTIEIENLGKNTVQLITRSWQIADAHGQIQDVNGPGVVGEQPILSPGQSFRYTSGAPLSTPSGMMMGSYQMETDAGECFDVEIPAFSLDCPYHTAKLN